MGSYGDVRVKIDEEAIRRCLSSECSFCRENCPAYRAFQLDSYSSRGKNRILKGYLEDKFESEELVGVAYSCTLCGYCTHVCLTNGAAYGYIRELRNELVRQGLAPDELNAMVNHINEMNTPFDKKDQSWIKKEKKGKIAYFPGCTIQAHNPGFASRTMTLLERIGIDAVPLSQPCCGSPVLRTGFIDDAKVIAEDFHAEIRKRKINTIITSCPGCTSMLKKEYPELIGAKIKVLHITEVLAKHRKKLFISQSASQKESNVIYHDPCILARELDIVDEPRKVLSALGCNLQEFDLNRYETSCCGGGAGFARNYPDRSLSVARKRIDEALELGVRKIITSCPLCKIMLTEASDGEIDVEDIVEMIEV